jgi:tetratricopeptide (TPR) repeat protein
MGDYDKALDYYKNGLGITQEIGDKVGIGDSFQSIGYVYYEIGNYDIALEYFSQSLKIREELTNKDGIIRSLGNIGIVYRYIGNYKMAAQHLENASAVIKDIEYKGRKELGYSDVAFWTKINLYLTHKDLGKAFDDEEIYSLSKKAKWLNYLDNYHLYQLLEDAPFLESAYKQVKDKADKMEIKFQAKFLSYPIPAAIVEEWEKVLQQ